ncbi:hypothetical protein RHMOL_Rhmol07G0200400 [Rhododendron molle]|uniref:Uncharacterized protein n=1 Tax=Rhododendron molle TaxID=49168 RepID=A0ACC0N2L3_RHOML|nr:hypothetical protein RHMOL_Rhmol07G0200400 [Rhododendron molle]
MIHWDPVMHVFRNYDNEMCPTVEEFQAYLPGFANPNVLAIPPVQENMSHLLMMKLNISGELTASIIHDGEIDIPRLIELYGPGGILTDHVKEAHKRFAFSICVLAAYALVPANGRVSPSVVSMASQMGARKNIIPTVLAETLMGLDLFKSRQSNLQWQSTVAPGFERVIIAGLTSFTFYIPGRILRQLGISQGLHKAGIEEFHLPDFNVPSLREYRRLWRQGVLEGPSSDFVEWLDGRYVAWLRAEIQTRPGGYY